LQQPTSPCERSGSTITKLDFYNSTISNNTLHLIGGELRYKGIGIVRDSSVDLVVTVTSGDYTNITNSWAAQYNVPVGGSSTPNGLNGNFGTINLQTKQFAPKSGEGHFRMCLVDPLTSEPTKAENFTFTVADLDQRRGEKNIKEKLIMDVSQAETYHLWNNTEIKMECEDGSTATPCTPGVRTVFLSTEKGIGLDNPDDPTTMTELQLKRAVSFTFVNTACWEFTYDHYCPLEYNNECRMNRYGYSGGYFLFAGTTERLVNEGECLTPPAQSND